MTLKIHTGLLEDFFKESTLLEPDGLIEEKSMSNSAAAFEYLMQFQALSPETIIAAHAKLAAGYLYNWDLGRTRTMPVTVGGVRTPKPYAVPALLQRWCEKYAGPKTMPTSEEDILSAHVKFERIHPFPDFNGRIGRIIWQWHRAQAGLPTGVILHSDREDYLALFDS